jgi:hypothetical protein
MLRQTPCGSPSLEKKIEISPVRNGAQQSEPVFLRNTMEIHDPVDCKEMIQEIW